MSTAKKILTRPAIITLIIVFVIAFFVFIFPPNVALQELYWLAQRNEVQRQMQLWEDQKITKYRLALKTTFCDYSEVIFEKDVSAKQITGDCTLTTINTLFLQINKMLDEKKCGADGCVCTGPYHMDVIYDEKYHYPKSAKPTYHDNYMYKNTNIFGVPGWYLTNYDMTGSFCMMYSVLEYNFGWDVYSFTPLQ